MTQDICGERIKRARADLDRVWKNRAGDMASIFKHADIIGALFLASELLQSSPGSADKELVILSDMQNSTRWLVHDRRIRQVWNVVEGHQSGLSVLIFDIILGEGRGMYCTFFACQTEQNPFGIDIAPDRVIQSHGWTALFRVRFLQIPWTMGVQRLDDHLNKLRIGSS
jgi:hypothetical protein